MKVHPMTGFDVGGPDGFEPDWDEPVVRSGGSTGRVGSFGMTRNGGTKMHKGVDWLCKPGDPIFFALDGVVGRCGEEVPRGRVVQDGRKGYGLRCYVKHNVTGDGKKQETRHAHMGVLFVKTGEKVRAGQIAGLAGRSGNKDRDVKTHHHFEIRINGNPTDPVQWLT